MATQLELAVVSKRRPGRPRKRAADRSQLHKRRPSVDAKHPLHVTLRTVGVGNLRRRHAYHAIREAMYCVVGRAGFRIVHLSMQHDHVHLIVEANHKGALAKGMQAFQISAAQRLNRAYEATTGRKRRGPVFCDRYHARPLTSPTTVRNALAYVLNNWRKHREDRQRAARTIDPYSSGINFGGWAELKNSGLVYTPPRGFSRLSTSLPRTWLLRVGWARAGAISAWTVPASS